MTIWQLERLRERQVHDDTDWLNTPIRLPRVDLWERGPLRRAEALYILRQQAHSNGAQPR
jgi:hypothetical protein